jgi:hypothetical protein
VLLVVGLTAAGCIAPRLTRPTVPAAPEAPQVAPSLAIAAPARPASQPVPPATAAAAPQLPATPPPNQSTVVPGTELRALYRRAIDGYAKVESYTARLHRREQVNGKARPEELMLFKFRREPFSVYLKWLSSEGQGREVVYVKGQHEDKIHTLTAAGDIPFVGAGKRIDLAPDSLLVRSASRHPITESGVGVLIDWFGQLLEATEREQAQAGTVQYVNLVQRPEFATPVACVLHRIPPGREPELSRGGQRLWFFDPDLCLPVLTVTTDASGVEVDYTCYERLQLIQHFGDDEFNPTKLWGR